MNLLLLLSALLSALTGVGATACAPRVARVAAEVVSSRPTETVRVSVAPRPTIRAFPLFESAWAGLTAAAPFVAREPIWASRRRE